MLKAILTYQEVITGSPPGTMFSLKPWNERGINNWLKAQGFDLRRTIWKREDPVTLSVEFQQLGPWEARWDWIVRNVWCASICRYYSWKLEAKILLRQIGNRLLHG